jgi:hypothetical protein
MFSGRFQLNPDADGTYFIDRDGRHFHHVLNFLRDAGIVKLSSVVMHGRETEELVVEARFYGLLDRMMTYYAQEQVGQSLLRRACLVGTRAAVQTAVAQVRTLIFTMGSTTPFLRERIQDLQYVITERVVNGSPVWAAEGSGGEELGMFRSAGNGMLVSVRSGYDSTKRFLQNALQTAVAFAPTELPSLQWTSFSGATLASEFASATPAPGSAPAPAPKLWVCVPEMRITAVHGLDDDDSAMAAALRQLAALA